MKAILKPFLLYLALVCSAVSAATLSPISLLNPAGSTSGQAIVSTGASTAPVWGNVTAGSITPIAANSVYGNFSGSSASPLANAVPSCSTANSALKYTSGTGLSCGTAFALTSGNLSQFASTTSAQLAGVLSNETGTGAVVFGTSPTINQPVINGTTDGSTPASGAVGYPVIGDGVAVSLSNSVAANCTSISLPAGDFEVFGNVAFNPGSGTAFSVMSAGASGTSATLPAAPGYVQHAYAGTTNFGQTVTLPTTISNANSTRTVYLVVNAGFSGGTATATCRIIAKRRS